MTLQVASISFDKWRSWSYRNTHSLYGHTRHFTCWNFTTV